MTVITKEALKKNSSRYSIGSKILIATGIIGIVALGDYFWNSDTYTQPNESLNSLEALESGRIQDELKFKPASANGSPRQKDDGTPKQDAPVQNMLFHHYLAGKSGAVIQDMLMCHAYAFKRNATYGGSCRGEVTPEVQNKSAANLHLLKAIGLQDELRFACSRDFYSDKATRRTTIPRDVCYKEDTRIWTPEYVDYLKSHVKYPKKVPDKFTIAVHIRRQEVTPCLKPFRGFDLYLPNSHYQALIDKYVQPDARVVIFSQNKSFESFDDFRAKGYELKLDDAVTDVWKTIAVSDVVILSRSSFSLIPAVVAKGTVVYTPFWHAPLKRWQVVDQKLSDRSHSETERLKTRCPTKNKVAGKTLTEKGRKKGPK